MTSRVFSVYLGMFDSFVYDSPRMRHMSLTKTSLYNVNNVPTGTPLNVSKVLTSAVGANDVINFSCGTGACSWMNKMYLCFGTLCTWRTPSHDFVTLWPWAPHRRSSRVPIGRPWMPVEFCCRKFHRRPALCKLYDRNAASTAWHSGNCCTYAGLGRCRLWAVVPPLATCSNASSWKRPFVTCGDYVTIHRVKRHVIQGSFLAVVFLPPKTRPLLLWATRLHPAGPGRECRLLFRTHRLRLVAGC